MRLKLLIITILTILFSPRLMAQDSLSVPQSQDSALQVGFWTRYSKPRMVAVDRTSDSIHAARMRKKVSFHYDLDFATYFDNREYREPFQIPQTIFNFRLSPEIGVRINDLAGGVHRIVAGVHYTQPLGGNWRDAKFDPTAFYHYNYRGLNLMLGAVPYTYREQSLSNWLMYDSIAYWHPNIQGALISYRDHRGFVEFMCDWRGSQTVERREMFRLIIDGEYQYKWLTLGGFLQMNHKARRKAPAPWEGVCDDIYISPQIGFDVTDYLPVDSFSLRLGYIIGLQNNRAAEDYQHPQGFNAELYFNWWFLGLKDEFYVGESLMPHYGIYGADLNQGDPFYQSRIYNRLDLFVYLYRSSFVDCHFSYNLHYDGVSLAHQQQLTVRFNLGGIWNKNGKYLKPIL